MSKIELFLTYSDGILGDYINLEIQYIVFPVMLNNKFYRKITISLSAVKENLNAKTFQAQPPLN